MVPAYLDLSRLRRPQKEPKKSLEFSVFYPKSHNQVR
jgi:hypothetical protein